MPIKKNGLTEALIIFIKNPELGKVKTRLAQSVGEAKALEIYRALLRHTRRVATRIEAGRYLYYSRFIDESDDWPPELFHKKLQSGGDLGARMAGAFDQILESHEKAVIIGSDCAGLSPEIIRQAFDLLEEKDLVLGPASDGGYYLLGMKDFHPFLFDEMQWSTSTVMADTLRRAADRNLSHALLPELSDIDYREDWEKYGWEL